MKWLIFFGVDLVLVAVVLLIPVGGGPVADELSLEEVAGLDLSGFSADPPAAPLRLLFIHHSCGGILLADPGEEDGESCIYRSHPEGGGLRRLLEQNGYEVHEASYGSRIGARTDIFDWPAKFRDQMAEILACAGQDRSYPDERRNRIVAFKSCFPNNAVVGAGEPPGRPEGPQLTVANAQAAYRALLPEFAKHPGVLFFCVTAPPEAPGTHRERLWRKLVRALQGRPDPASRLRESGLLARRFYIWLRSPEGWLFGDEGRNVVVCDYYDIRPGGYRLSLYPTRQGFDSHPSRQGNQEAVQAFVPMLNRAVRRAGLSR